MNTFIRENASETRGLRLEHILLQEQIIYHAVNGIRGI